MDEKKIKEVFSDEEFMKHLVTLDEPEDVQKALKEKGIDLTVEQIVELKDRLVNFSDQELSESELEATAGGGSDAGTVGDILKIAGYGFDGLKQLFSDLKGKW